MKYPTRLSDAVLQHAGVGRAADGDRGYGRGKSEDSD